MMCQRTTNAVSYMYHSLGYSCTNYIDDFGGADTADRSTQAFVALGDLFTYLIDTTDRYDRLPICIASYL